MKNLILLIVSFIVASIEFTFASEIDVAHSTTPLLSHQPTMASIEQAAEKLIQLGYLGQGEFFKVIKDIDSNISWPVLKLYMDNPDPIIQSIIIDALWIGKVSCEEAGSKVAGKLLDVNSEVKRKALYYIGTQKCQREKDRVLNVLTRESDQVLIKNAIDVLGRIGDGNDFETLLTFQKSSQASIEIRLAAATSLAMLGGPYDRQLILRSLRSGNDQVAAMALLTLCYVKDPILLPEVAKFSARNDEIGTRAQLAYHSIEINRQDKSDQEKREFLFSQLATRQRPEVQYWAVEKLFEQFDSESTRNRLKQMSEDNNNPYRFALLEKLEEKGLITKEDKLQRMRSADRHQP